VQELLNFDVVIEARGEGYTTRILSSPAGEAQTDFTLPFTDEGLQNLILEIKLSIGQERRRVRRIESPERRLLEDFGARLFQAAFAGHVRECLGRSLLTAEQRDAGLRIRLRLPGVLANIPWEYLHDSEYGFLGLSPETVLVRYLDTSVPARPFAISPPLRILAMISAPADVSDLKGEEEWDKLNNALGGLIHSGMVQVDRLEAGNLAALQLSLRRAQYHVLHFIGHGSYDERAQDGALCLEGIGGRTRLVTGRDLGIMIRGHRSLRMVVLNACEGARSARDDPFGGVAQALVRQGTPAVVAMQFEITDEAALVFSHSFYEAIADGLPVDISMVEARRSIFARGNEVEWATPVLYLRSSDGRIFAIPRETMTPANPVRSPDGDADQPVSDTETASDDVWDSPDSEDPRDLASRQTGAAPFPPRQSVQPQDGVSDRMRLGRTIPDQRPTREPALLDVMRASPRASGRWVRHLKRPDRAPFLSGRFILLLDCSADMAGDKIQSLNFAVREMLRPLHDTVAENPGCTLLFQAITISTEARWHVPATPLDDVRWLDVKAAGGLALGKAFSMLARELSSPAMPTRGLPPTVLLILSRGPTDDWQAGLQELNRTRWGPHTTRLTIAIGRDAPMSTLRRFMGTPGLEPLQANNVSAVTNYVRWAEVELDTPEVW
jgi:uncharacterized protein YegL